MAFSWNLALFHGQFRENGQFWQFLRGSKKWSIKTLFLDKLLVWATDCIRKKPGERVPGSDVASTDVLGVHGVVVHGVVVPGGMGPGHGADCSSTPWYGSGPVQYS